MIVDRLGNASMYFGLGERLATALRYLQSTDLDAIQPGRYEVDGSRLFVLVQQYDTKPKEKGFWEAHRNYIDVQYVHQGVELIGYANLEYLKAGEYDPARDFVPAEGQGEYFQLRAGCF